MMLQESRNEIQKEIRQMADDVIRNGVLEELFKQSITLGSIMKRDLVTLDHTKTAYDAALLMIQKGVGCVVVTAYGKPFGIITERDIVCAVAGLKIPLRNLVLSVLASRPIICVEVSQTVEEAAELMRKYNIRRLLIVNKDEIVGIVTTRDLSVYLPII